MPGEVTYRWRVGDGQIDAAGLEDGLLALTSASDLEEAVNSELAYTASMVFYLRSYEQDARTLLEDLSTYIR